MTRDFASHESHRVRLKYNDILKEFYNSTSRKISDLIKANGDATTY